MTDALQTALTKLTDIQRKAAVDSNEGAFLVLAGPGSGKTQVLTCRIARLLDASRNKNFRILALTFTNMAADEMKNRISNFVPGLEERANIATFHGFCAQMLRQHGVHLGINPDFAIYAADSDRRVVLEEALRRNDSAGQPASGASVDYLGLIDWLKARLIEPSAAAAALPGLTDREKVVATYLLYEKELRRINALDYSSLILEACRLLTAFPAIAGRYRKSYPFWLIDEFQDTNSAQYKLVRLLAGNEFRNIFVVADDDQIIYQWNGASFRQIQSFIADFAAEVIQLPTNYRCPPAIVEAANRLVSYNAQRADSKKPLVAGKTELKFPPSEHIQVRVFSDDEEETLGIAQEIAARGPASWGQTTILARTRVLLESMHKGLRQNAVSSVIAQRRDDFLSAEFRWLVASIKQIVRPLDIRNMAVLVEAFNRMSGVAIASDQIITGAEATGHSYFATWVNAMITENVQPPHDGLIQLISPLAIDPSKTKETVERIIDVFAIQISTLGGESDLAEDMAAWREISRDIGSHIGRNAPLDQFLQELQLRSKEPTPKPNTVTLMTIHGAKGREFDSVYVIGLVEDVMPSYQSKQKGEHSAEMEEERRNCFVAITRAKECLVLSRAGYYRGWQKQPSRFLVEMGLVHERVEEEG